MKTTATIITVVIVGAVALAYQYGNVEMPSYERESTVEVPEVKEVKVELDTIEKARQELERINAELDAKETELLQERDAIDAELERLRETRVSFQ